MGNQLVVLDTKGCHEVLIQVSKEYSEEPFTVVVPRYTIVEDERGKRMEGVDSEIQIDPIEVLTYETAGLIIQEFVLEFLSSMVHYKHPRDVQYHVAKILTGVEEVDQPQQRLAEEFISHPDVDALEISLTNQLLYYIDGKTWNQWDLLGDTKTFILVCGKDYRIAEWEKSNQNALRYHDDEITEDLSAMLNYFHQEWDKHFEIPVPNKPLKNMICEYMQSLCDPYSSDLTYTTAFMTDLNWFYNQVMQPLIRQIFQTQIKHRLVLGMHYKCSMGQTGQLHVYTTEPSHKSNMYRILELKESIERGDWVPPEDRRWYEQQSS